MDNMYIPLSNALSIYIKWCAKHLPTTTVVECSATDGTLSAVSKSRKDSIGRIVHNFNIDERNEIVKLVARWCSLCFNSQLSPNWNSIILFTQLSPRDISSCFWKAMMDIFYADIESVTIVSA